MLPADRLREADLSTSDLGDVPGLELGHRYARAPIVEAILEFQVHTTEELTMEHLTVLRDDGEFTKAEPLFTLESQFDINEGAVTGRAAGSQVGWALQRPDGHRVVQAGLDRFAFIWRGQYDTWDAFLAEAEAQWLRYREVAKPTMVGLVGVRFVNRIPMPKPSVEIKDYLRTSVEISPYLPQSVSGLFMQVAIPLPKLGADAIVTSAMESQEGAPGVVLLLDVDVKMVLNMGPSADDFDPSLKAILTKLREVKNYVFEACITDATRGLID